ncbi:hypothetical protein TNCV_1942421 [Trichonephila clavipes]|nr:hypothetical protein TNCV_1942421 [Trichonephila clavipes]
MSKHRYIQKTGSVWCALCIGGILLQNDEGQIITLQSDRYVSMITNFFIPELNTVMLSRNQKQQDGATCHTARATIELIERHVW